VSSLVSEVREAVASRVGIPASDPRTLAYALGWIESEENVPPLHGLYHAEYMPWYLMGHADQKSALAQDEMAHPEPIS
jgi:hypothetical protein